MSTQELQLSLISQILQTVDENVLKLLQKTLSKSKKTSKSSKTTWENCNSPIREMTTEEAKIIAEFEANPEIATREKVLEMEQKLGIKLT